MDSNLLRDIDYYMSRQKTETYSTSRSHSPSFSGFLRHWGVLKDILISDGDDSGEFYSEKKIKTIWSWCWLERTLCFFVCRGFGRPKMDGETSGERLVGPTRFTTNVMHWWRGGEGFWGAASGLLDLCPFLSLSPKARRAGADQTDSCTNSVQLSPTVFPEPQIQLVSDEKSGNRTANIHTASLSGQKKRKVSHLKIQLFLWMIN